MTAEGMSSELPVYPPPKCSSMVGVRVWSSLRRVLVVTQCVGASVEIGNGKPSRSCIVGRSGGRYEGLCPGSAYLNLGTQRVIDLNGRNIVFGLRLIRVEIVVDQLGRVGPLRVGDQSLNLQSDRIELRQGNRISGERTRIRPAATDRCESGS